MSRELGDRGPGFLLFPVFPDLGVGSGSCQTFRAVPGILTNALVRATPTVLPMDSVLLAGIGVV
jgi:hypothetical protein